MTDQEIMLRCIEALTRGGVVREASRTLMDAEKFYEAVKAKAPAEPQKKAGAKAQAPS